MKIRKGDFPLKLEIVGLDESALAIDISIFLPDKKAPDEKKTVPKPKNTIALF